MPMEIQLVKIYSCKFCKNMTVNKCVPLFKVILRCEQIMQTQYYNFLSSLQLIRDGILKVVTTHNVENTILHQITQSKVF